MKEADISIEKEKKGLNLEGVLVRYSKGNNEQPPQQRKETFLLKNTLKSQREKEKEKGKN